MSADPLLSSGSPINPKTWNRYTYALDNPLRIVDPTGLWDWDESAGGDMSDDDLSAIANDKHNKRHKWAKKALNFRDQFRDALDDANSASESDDLDSEQKADVTDAVNSYGSENDQNGVTVGFHTGADPGETTPKMDGTINVSFRSDQRGDKLATLIGHEGVHVEDNESAQQGAWITHYTTESQGYLVGSYVAQGLGMRVYPTDSGSLSQYQAWNKGWRTADVETFRSRGVANILRDYYPGSQSSVLPRP